MQITLTTNSLIERIKENRLMTTQYCRGGMEQWWQCSPHQQMLDQVITGISNCLQTSKPSQYVTSHTGQLSLAIPPQQNEHQRKQTHHMMH